MFIKKAILRVGFANFTSTMAFLFSCTALVIVARISSEYTQSKLSNTKPPVIRNGGPLFVEQENGTDPSSESYENVLKELEVDEIGTNIKFDENQVQPTESAIREQNEQARQNKKLEAKVAKIQEFERGIERVSAKDYASSGYNKRQNVVTPIKAPRNVRKTRDQTNQGSEANVVQQGNSRSAVFESLEGKIVKIDKSAEGEYKKVQIGTFEKHEEAIAGWFRMKKEHRGTLDAFRYSIDISTNDYGKRIFRLYIDTKSEDEAKKLCTDFKRRNIDCVVVK
jgi:hypothetical protein